MKDLKYLASFSIPLTAILGLYVREEWVFLTPVVAFVLVPILEIILPIKTANLSENEVLSKDNNRLFNVLLYLNLPLVYGILGWFLWNIPTSNYSTTELVGLLISVGIVLGSNGINVAHELGHRKLQWEKTLGKVLLLPALYMHFYIEHNFGHHLHAATKEDPASAKYNQSVYSFWFTSSFRQYFSAWKIQLKLLRTNGLPFYSFKNDMFWYLIIQFAYVLLIFFLFGIKVFFVAIGIAVVGVLLLETINYIEHYGLSRNKNKSGRYERVSEIHSWNSNHVLGRIMLYELTRHSDHHYKSHKKYQLLDYHNSSPQMPYGYPTSMVLSLIPPLWFSIMNTRIPVEMKA
ncbi:alkane 1-monooxygenase [Jejudonia soesokkakensis]|uniref:Alkane 1-monooxygenase n=1 Tax=Jejudonia soesokkakensis TaxID=1323432 RepID=A0ABW2MSC4_9FLAO